MTEPKVEAQQAAGSDEKLLRRMLCAAIGGSLAYMDDGEAFLSGPPGLGIDFLRMPAAELQAAIRERGLSLINAPPKPQAPAVAVQPTVEPK
jgi:hypothetical protein